MDATVLAGPIEFSPADIALILAVLAAAAVAVTSPGWVVLAYVMGRRVPATAAANRRRWATVGGAALGIAVSFGAASLAQALVDGGVLAGVLAAWVACWGLAALLHRPPSAPASAPATDPGPAPAARPGSTEGWGR